MGTNLPGFTDGVIEAAYAKIRMRTNGPEPAIEETGADPFSTMAKTEA